MANRAPQEHLPLRPVEFQILLSLGLGPRHGYRIIQDAEERGEGHAVPGLATLYRALRRLEAETLIARATEQPVEDERRRPYRLTELGTEVARLEAQRLAAQLRSAEDAAFIGTQGGQ